MAYPEPVPSPLTTYTRLQTALDQDILRALGVTSSSVQSELRRLQSRVGVGAEVRSYQLTGTLAAIDREMARYWDRVGDTTKAHQLNAAATAAEETFRSAGLVDRLLPAEDVAYMVESVRAGAERGLESAMERISGSSYIPLAESVYDNAALSSGKIDDLVTAALARGASAKELADDVYDFVNPNTPGGARYASMRLARTELNNAFHASSVRQAQAQPWTLALDWNLSGSHPVPDECNTYAEQVHFEGGEPGQFRPEEVPAKPHPNCLCYTTTSDMDPDEFLRRFNAGEMDDYLDAQGPPGQKVSESRAEVSELGSDSLRKGLADAEFAREELIYRRFIRSGKGKGNYDPEKGWGDRNKSQSHSMYVERGIPFNELSRNPEKYAAENGDAMVEFMAENCEDLDALIALNRIDRDVTVARGVLHDVSDIQEGDFIADPGFLSTSSDLQTAISFASNSRFEAAAGFKDLDKYLSHVQAAKQDGWVFIIKAPEGTNAVHGDVNQKEIVFPRNTKQRVLRVDPEARVIYTEVVN